MAIANKIKLSDGTVIDLASGGLVLGETSGTAYEGSKGKKNADDIITLQDDVANLTTGKQDKLISGTNIKTINGTSLLGSGDIVIQGGGSGATTINFTGELESVETLNLIVQYLNEKGLESITNVEPLYLVNEAMLEFYYILPFSCINSREFYMLADSIYGKYVFGSYETSNGRALKKYWNSVDIVEWFNEKLDITEAQKTGGQKLTWKEEIDPILVESFVNAGFIPYYNAICNMSGLDATYRLLPIASTNSVLVFSNRITALDQGVPREQVFLLSYDGVTKETTFLVYDISQ